MTVTGAPCIHYPARVSISTLFFFLIQSPFHPCLLQAFRSPDRDRWGVQGPGQRHARWPMFHVPYSLSELSSSVDLSGRQESGSATKGQRAFLVQPASGEGLVEGKGLGGAGHTGRMCITTIHIPRPVGV